MPSGHYPHVVGVGSERPHLPAWSHWRHRAVVAQHVVQGGDHLVQALRLVRVILRTRAQAASIRANGATDPCPTGV
jgi:hypothetical protein